MPHVLRRMLVHLDAAPDTIAAAAGRVLALDPDPDGTLAGPLPGDDANDTALHATVAADGTVELVASSTLRVRYFQWFYGPVLLWFLRRRIGRIELKETIRSSILVLVASAALAVVSHEVWRALDSALGRGVGAQIVSLLVALGAGVATYLGVCLLLGVRELRPLLSVGGHDR